MVSLGTETVPDESFDLEGKQAGLEMSEIETDINTLSYLIGVIKSSYAKCKIKDLIQKLQTRHRKLSELSDTRCDHESS